jgi:outer membrane protein OmpA-like peptidoglycan-associated protein
MELVIKSNSNGETRKTGVSKKITVLDNLNEKESYLSGLTNSEITDIAENENIMIDTQFSAEDEFKKDAVYNVEVTSSITKLGVDHALFKNVPKIYTLTEKFIPEESIYSYIVDQQMTLMATYPAFTQLYSLGYRNARIKTFVLTEPSEKELYGLIKINGAFADTYFDETGRLTANAFIVLDQIVKLMNKYPSIKLEVAVHTDNSAPAQTSLALSQSRAQLLVSYLVNRGIGSKRLRATGFGGTKPISSNYLEPDRKLNRRIDFIIINQ